MDPTSLDKLFSNDLVAIDAARDGSAFFIVSRGGNFVFRATLDGTGKLTLGTPPVAHRHRQPAERHRRQRRRHARLRQQRAERLRHLGRPREQRRARPEHPDRARRRRRAPSRTRCWSGSSPSSPRSAWRRTGSSPSRSATSTRTSSAAGSRTTPGAAAPRATPTGSPTTSPGSSPTARATRSPLDAFFAKDNPADQRISNWSARPLERHRLQQQLARRAGRHRLRLRQRRSDGPEPEHLQPRHQPGRERRARPPDAVGADDPPAEPAAAGQRRPPDATLFEDNCASCHGGAKWTKSQVLYLDNPANISPRSHALRRRATRASRRRPAAQIDVLTSGAGDAIDFLLDAGTFDPMSPFEIKAERRPAARVVRLQRPEPPRRRATGRPTSTTARPRR